jgi:hypothetical protein
VEGVAEVLLEPETEGRRDTASFSSEACRGVDAFEGALEGALEGSVAVGGGPGAALRFRLMMRVSSRLKFSLSMDAVGGTAMKVK